MAFIVFKTTKSEKHMLKIRFLFSSELTAVMCAIGNARANSVWEGKIQNKAKPSPSSSRYNRLAFDNRNSSASEYFTNTVCKQQLSEQVGGIYVRQQEI